MKFQYKDRKFLINRLKKIVFYKRIMKIDQLANKSNPLAGANRAWNPEILMLP